MPTTKFPGEDAVTAEAEKFGGVPSFTEVPLLAAAVQARADPRHIIYRFNNGLDALRFRTEFDLSSKVRTRKIKGRSGFFVRVKDKEFNKFSRSRSLKGESGKGQRHTLKAASFGDSPLPGESQKEFAKRRAGPLGRKRGL